MMNINQEVCSELTAMKSVGITVTDKALSKAKSEDLTEYEYMSVGEIADLLMDLYN